MGSQFKFSVGKGAKFSQEDLSFVQSNLKQLGIIDQDLPVQVSGSASLPPHIVAAIKKHASEYGLVVVEEQADDGVLDAILKIINGRICGVPDPSAGELLIKAYGAPGGRWDRGNLTYRVDPSGANLPPSQVISIIDNAFRMWQTAAAPFFSFMRVNGDADIDVRFGSSTLEKGFGQPGGVMGVGQYPPRGKLYLDATESWTPKSLASVALHEIGHVLGLGHSTTSTSIMYPYTGATTLDNESRAAIRGLYGWQQQVRLSDRGSSDGPALAVAGVAGFGHADYSLHMVWKGVDGDAGLYWSRFNGGSWGPQQKIEGVGSSHGPALASYNATQPGGAVTTGLFMAWKGVEGDQGIYYSRNPSGSAWESQRKVPDVGTSSRPALAEFGNRIWMAWKGVQGDQGIYFSTFDGFNWRPQTKIHGPGTSEGPALAVLGNRLYMVWKGVEGDSNVYYSWIGDQGNAIWQPQRAISYPDPEIEGIKPILIGSSSGPSIVARDSFLVAAWKGIPGDSGLWFSSLVGDEWNGQINVAGVGSSARPALVVFNGRLYMAWKGIGGDSNLYYSWLV